MLTSIIKIPTISCLSIVLEKNIGHTIEFLELYIKIIPSQKEQLQNCFNNRKKDEFYLITRQIMTSFKMIGFPELSDQLYDFAVGFKHKDLAYEADKDLISILNKIELTITFVETELTKLKTYQKTNSQVLINFDPNNLP
jgi:hypothetical protein